MVVAMTPVCVLGEWESNIPVGHLLWLRIEVFGEGGGHQIRLCILPRSGNRCRLAKGKLNRPHARYDEDFCP